MEEMKLSPPWDEFYREILEMFENDPEIQILYDRNGSEIKLLVDNNRKASALEKLLPKERAFGNVVIKVTVVPSNDEDEKVQLLLDAFEGNPVVVDVHRTDAVIGSFTYLTFQKKVVQYFDDSLSDVNGVRSTLYQEIAKDLFEDRAGAFFCTDIK